MLLRHEHNRQSVTAPPLREETLAVATQVAAEILCHRIRAVVADDVVDAVAEELDSVRLGESTGFLKQRVTTHVKHRLWFSHKLNKQLTA